MSVLRAALLLSLAECGGGAPAAVELPRWPVVNTSSGDVRGSIKFFQGVTQFLGIPFAAPPTGERRFRPPRPPQPWDGARDGSSWPPICVHDIVLPFDTIIGQENCLYVNVIVPSTLSPLEKRPVLLWIYGGAFEVGDGHSFGAYDGTHLAHRNDAVVVTFNYRLGVFGHMALDSLLAEEGTTGNYAMQDQRAAMRWTQDNIENFGGDSSRVTIFGESAGAISVCYHYASPASRGLFHAAIMQSGSCDSSGFFQPLGLATNYSSAYADRVGCEEDPGAPAGDASRLRCLRSKSVLDVLNAAKRWEPWPEPPQHEPPRQPLEQVLAASSPEQRAAWEALAPASSLRVSRTAVPLFDPLCPFGPVIDGTEQGLAEIPIATLERGDFDPSIPLLIGTNLNEGTIFTPMPVQVVRPTPEFPLPEIFPTTELGLNRTINHFFPTDPPTSPSTNPNVRKVIMAYTSAQAEEDGLVPFYLNKATSIAAALTRDWIFTCGSRRAARAITASGGRVFMYEWRHDITHWLDGELLGGNYHASELSFVWDNEFPPLLHAFTPADQQMATWIGSRWTNLARSLRSPNPENSSEWPVWTEVDEEYLVLEVPPTVERKLRSNLCDTVWNQLPA
jgi:para-nitrobenzyl esterase